MNKEYAERVIAAAFDAIIAREMACEGCGKATRNDYCDDCVEELRQQHERQMQGWMNTLDQDDQAIQEFCDE